MIGALLSGYFSSANTCPKAIFQLAGTSKSNSTLPFVSLESLQLHHGLLSESADIIGENYGPSFLRNENFQYFPTRPHLMIQMIQF